MVWVDAVVGVDEADGVVAAGEGAEGSQGPGSGSDILVRGGQGEYMVDTNCMFFTRECARLLGFWITPPSQVRINDRKFWAAVKSSGLRIVRCQTPTVTYATKWAFHYGYAGADVPPDAVWFRYADPQRTSIRRDNQGLIRHGDLTREQQEEALRTATAHLGVRT